MAATENRVAAVAVTITAGNSVESVVKSREIWRAATPDERWASPRDPDAPDGRVPVTRVLIGSHRAVTSRSANDRPRKALLPPGRGRVERGRRFFFCGPPPPSSSERENARRRRGRSDGKFARGTPPPPPTTTPPPPTRRRAEEGKAKRRETGNRHPPAAVSVTEFRYRVCFLPYDDDDDDDDDDDEPARSETAGRARELAVEKRVKLIKTH